MRRIDLPGHALKMLTAAIPFFESLGLRWFWAISIPMSLLYCVELARQRGHEVSRASTEEEGVWETA